MPLSLLKIASDFDTQLASLASIGDTTATLVSATDDDGNALPTGTYGFTIDAGNSSKEYIICTLTSTALTSIQSISRQGVTSTGFARSHRRGAKVTLTDWAIIKRILNNLDGTTGFNSLVKLGYDADPGLTSGDTTKFATVQYVNDTASAGTPDASTTVKGKSKLSTAPVSPTDPIAVGDNDPRVPTQGENDALVGTSGTPSSSNKYVTNDDTTGTGSVVRQSVLTASSTVDFVFGETITAGQALYIKQSDGRVYKASSAAPGEALYSFIGIAYEPGTVGQTKKVVPIDGTVTGLSFGNQTDTISETTDLSQTIVTTNNTYSMFSGVGVPPTLCFKTGNKVGNITKIDILAGVNTGVGAGNVTCAIHEFTYTTTGITLGASLGSKINATWTSSATNTFTFASPISLKPNTFYAARFTADGGNGLNYYTIAGDQNLYSNGSNFTLDGSGFAVYYSRMQFTTYYTSQINYYIGDTVYLSDTAGNIVSGLSTGTYCAPIGKVLSPTSIKLSIPEKKFIFSTNVFLITKEAGVTTGRWNYIAIPRNTTKIVVTIKETNSGVQHTHIKEVSELGGIISTFEDNDGGTQIITTLDLDSNGNRIVLNGSNQTPVSYNASISFYS